MLIMLTTIGYERSTLDDFIATLLESRVEILVDIRDRAQSRMRGFSKSALSDAVRQSGIEYMHLSVLGDPKEGRDAARSGDYDKFRKIYQNVLNSEMAQEAILELKILADNSNICLMCFEVNIIVIGKWWQTN
jgi:uncharacterized protein (DUF488 family)